MRVRPELDPDVDDLAPSGREITAYDERHFVTYLRLLDARRMEPTGQRRLASFCTAIRNRNRVEPGPAGKATLPAHGG